MTEEQRKQNLLDRFNSLIDMRLAFHTLYPEEPNPMVFIKNVIDNEDQYVAENIMLSLENKDNEQQTSTEKIYNDYIEARNAEYLRRGVTRDAIMEAQWEKDMEGRPEKADALQLIRLEVKQQIPKP